MSRKIIKMLDLECPNLLRIEPNHPIYEEQISDLRKRLLRNSMHNLKTASTIVMERSTFLKKHKPDDPEFQSALFELELLESVIFEKKEQYQKRNYQVEKNIIEYPVFTSSNKDINTLRGVKGVELVVERNGFRKLTYTNANNTLLTAYDLKVLTSLVHIWRMKERPKKLEVSLNELTKAMQVESSGGEYKLIFESLNDLWKTELEMEAFYDDKVKENYKIAKRRIITELDGTANRREGEEIEWLRAKVKFADWFVDSIESGNYIMISMLLLNDLMTPIAQNLYVNVLSKIKDTRDGDKACFEIDPLINHLDLKDSNRSRIIKKIDSAFKELKDVGVIKDYYAWGPTKRKLEFFSFTFNPSDYNTDDLKYLESHHRPFDFDTLETEQLSFFAEK